MTPADTLRDLAASCGEERPASVSRELSKLYEETRRGSLRELHEHYAATEVRGEIIVVGPASEPAASGAETGMASALSSDFSLVAARLALAGVRGRLLRGALEALGASRNLAYALAQAAQEQHGEE